MAPCSDDLGSHKDSSGFSQSSAQGSYLSARCDKALAAAERSAGEELGSRRTADAREAARALVASTAERRCVNALAAAERSRVEEDGSDNTLEARDAAALLVSLAIERLRKGSPEQVTKPNKRRKGCPTGGRRVDGAQRASSRASRMRIDESQSPMDCAASAT